MKSIVIYALFLCNTQPGALCANALGTGAYFNANGAGYTLHWPNYFDTRAECMAYMKRIGRTETPDRLGDYARCLSKRVDVWSEN
jgi:hypothetical protein